MTTSSAPEDELARFVRQAIDFGWPDNTVQAEIDDLPGFWVTRYEDGAWSYRDLWCGSSTDSGGMIVFHDDEAAWSCLYRGGLLFPDDAVDLSFDGNELFSFLIRAIRSDGPTTLPLRGPDDHIENGFVYRMRSVGSMASFFATESILRDGRRVYERLFIGGRFGDGVLYGEPIGEGIL